MAEKGFGLWWTDTTGVFIPENFNNMQALRIIGYDIKDSIAVIQTFKRKYLQQEGSKDLTTEDKKVLFTLYKQFL